MFDKFQKDQLHAVISFAISDGMKLGAAHIAEALAEVKRPAVSTETSYNGVSWSEFTKALNVLVDENTYIYEGALHASRQGAYGEKTMLAAWTVVRKALGLPT